MKARIAVIAVLLVAGACSGGDDAATTTTERATTEAPGTTAATDTTVAADTTAVSGGDTSTTAPEDFEPGSWTVLVYVIGDTDLEPFAVQDLIEMATVGSGTNLNIVALVDRHPEFSDEDVLNMPNWEDTKLISVQQGELVEVAGGTEQNLGSADTFATFIEQGITTFPADHYAVVLWDHGAGWPGMGPDETDGLDVLDLAEIDEGLTRGLAAAGVDKVDLLGFDACLMATYEVAGIAAKHADYMLASEELEPGHGWNYEGLSVLHHPGATPIDLGTSLVKWYAEQAEEQGTEQDITLSLLDLSQMPALQAALGDLAAPIIADPIGTGPALGGARSRTLMFGRDPNPDNASNMGDLGDLAVELAAAAPEFAPQAQAVVDAIDALVVYDVKGPASAAAQGLAVYFPEFQRNFRQGYLFLEDVPHWPDMLSAYYQAGDAIPPEQQPEFVETDFDDDGELEEFQAFFDQDGLNVFAFFDAAAAGNVVGAEIFYGLFDPDLGLVTFIGEEPAEVSDDGSGLVAAIYDLTVMTVSDGIDTSFAYLDLDVDHDTGLAFIDIPLVYEPPDGGATDQVVLSLVVDVETLEILEETYFVVDESGTFGEITTDPFGLIYPIVLQQDADGNEEWVVTSEIGLFADLPALQYDFQPLDSGLLLYAELVVFDYGGNTASVEVLDLVP